ncbi:MAG TPA: alpha/beta fold hydrolase, partial [Actinomycetes bacterium]
RPGAHGQSSWRRRRATAAGRRRAIDAAALLRTVDIERAHVAGFSSGSMIAQELALRHPDLVRSLVLVGTWARFDPYARRMVAFWSWLADAAPSERAFQEWFLLWIYTHRAHTDGLVDQLIEESLAFPHPASAESIRRTIEALVEHQTGDRLPDIAAPTLVLAGELDIAASPQLGRVVADGIPGARFELWPGEVHQPFQESPQEFNARVDAFWREVEAGS